MKRNTLIAVVLCLMMITTAEAGGKSAKQENPRQAGKSSIYFYDVEVPNGNGYGRLVINTDKHTFTFIGQDFKPDQRVYLQFKTDGDFAVFASGKSTPSGNLHVAGTWELDAFPEVVDAVYYLYPPAYGFSLTNQGGFMAKLAVYWTTDTEWANPVEPTWHETSKASDSFGLNKSRLVNLKEFGDIPEGAWVRIHAIVVGGKDRTSSEYYTYASGQCYIPGFCYPDYTISRTTWNPILEWWRTDCYCGALASDPVQ